MHLIVFSPYYAPHVGGVESYVAELHAELLTQDAALRITVLAPDLPGGSPAVERLAEGCTLLRYPAVEAIPNFPLPAFHRRDLWRALRAARADAPDVVISHTRFFVSSLVATVWARRRRVPTLHVEHGSEHVQLDSRLHSRIAWAYDRTIGRWVLRRATAIVAVSAAAAEFVRSLSDRSAEVVHRGLSAAVHDGIAPDPDIVVWAAGRPMITYVGRLIDGKGVTDLLEALPGLHGSWCCCLVGDGPQKDALRALARVRGIDDRVCFTGAVEHDRALAIVRASAVVVNPSYTEGLPTVVLEAAALGRPILATDVGGTGEIVRSGVSGILVGPRAPAELTAALTTLLADGTLRERLGKAAREHARTAFRWDVAAERYRALAAAIRVNSAS